VQKITGKAKAGSTCALEVRLQESSQPKAAPRFNNETAATPGPPASLTVGDNKCLPVKEPALVSFYEVPLFATNNHLQVSTLSRNGSGVFDPAVMA